MNVKDRFVEGWVMLLRPFSFVELKEPLQKMTILYAFSDEPVYETELTSEGRAIMSYIHGQIGKPFGLSTEANNIWRRGSGEKNDDLYDYRIDRQLEIEVRKHQEKRYIGQKIIVMINGVECKFFPEEYNTISKETLEYLPSAEEYEIEVLNKNGLADKVISDRLYYIRTRGISEKDALRMIAPGLKDSAIFRPTSDLLNHFCRPHEIY